MIKSRSHWDYEQEYWDLFKNSGQDDIERFTDHWIIVRKDGTPILNGTPEQFETALRAFIRGDSYK